VPILDLEPDMAMEIERKFLLRGNAWRSQVHATRALAQGYLGGDRCSVRVRVDGDQAHLNIKSKVRGSSRLEFEYPIPLSDARVLLSDLAGAEISKTRHLVRHGAHLWEVDEFAGANLGLVVAEVELSSEDEVFERPSWLGREVTDEERFYNAALVQSPFCDWSDRSTIVAELAC
jgi:adenylate cyclase